MESHARDDKGRKNKDPRISDSEHDKINLGFLAAKNLPNSYVSIIEKDFTVGYSFGSEFEKQNLDPDTYIGTSIEEVFMDKADLVKSYYKRTFKGEECTFELFYNNQNQLYTTKPVISNDGSINRIIVYVENITSQITAKIELQNSEAKFKNLYDNAPIPYQSLNEDGSFRDVNNSWLETLGYNREEVIGKFYIDFLHPDWQDHFKTNFPVFKKIGHVHNVQFRIRHKDGHYLDISFEGCIGYNPDGSFRQTYCVFQDISDKKKLDKRLIESEKKFRILADNTGDWEYWLDQNGKYVFISKSCEKVTGYRSNEFMENPELLFDIIHPDDKKRVHKHYEEGKNRDYPPYKTEFRIINKKKEVVWVEHNCHPIFDDDGIFMGRRGNNRDITDRKQYEEELVNARKTAEKNEAFFTAALENSQAGIAIANVPDGKLLFVNNAGLLIRNKKHEEIVKNVDIEKYVSSWNIFHFDGTPYNPNEVPLARAVLYGETVGEEFIVRRDNDEDRVVWANAAPIYDNDGNQIAAIVVFLDITDRKKAQEQLKISNNQLRTLNSEYLIAKQQAEESERLKSAFLANMSHEIRTPMNGIMGFLEIIQTSDPDEEDRGKYLDIIRQSGDRLLNTINDIIQISKIESGQVEIGSELVDIKELMNYYNDFFQNEARNKGISLKMDCCCEKAEMKLYTDKIKLDSIITNLIKNAIKFTDEGYVACNCSLLNNGYLKVEVVDTGGGINSENLKTIFDRFVQADMSYSRGYEGSGLGLSIVKAFVEMLGGEITVESKVGVGSKFTFTIKDNRGKKREEKQQTTSIEKIIKSNEKELTILVAEDDQVSYELIRTILEAEGYKTVHASDGIEAVELLKGHPDFDIILMDLKMPRLDGFRATQQIRSFNKKIPIIAQTAFALSGDREKAIEAGCNEYISKPVVKDELIEKINALT